LMPEMDGFSAALEVRKRKITTPIIALTASATSNVRNRIEIVGMQDYVTKPFNPKELFQKMMKLLN
jgi:CheY-like chemotaxis protein